jgi:hypothetical protein
VAVHWVVVMADLVVAVDQVLEHNQDLLEAQEQQILVAVVVLADKVDHTMEAVVLDLVVLVELVRL